MTLVANDPELGALRWCRGCEEWLPDDREFFFFEPKRPGVRHCKACKAAYVRKLREATFVLGPVPCQGCRRSVVWGPSWHNGKSLMWRNAATGHRHFCPLALEGRYPTTVDNFREMRGKHAGRVDENGVQGETRPRSLEVPSQPNSGVAPMTVPPAAILRRVA